MYFCYLNLKFIIDIFIILVIMEILKLKIEIVWKSSHSHLSEKST